MLGVPKYCFFLCPHFVLVLKKVICNALSTLKKQMSTSCVNKLTIHNAQRALYLECAAQLEVTQKKELAVCLSELDHYTFSSMNAQSLSPLKKYFNCSAKVFHVLPVRLTRGLGVKSQRAVLVVLKDFNTYKA